MTLSNYPTKGEILKNLCKPIKSDVTTLLEWKARHYINKWSKKTNIEKINSLQRLIEGLVSQHAPNSNIVFVESYQWAQCTPDSSTKIFYMQVETPSILSCLHEIGHAIHGASELSACCYSIALFQECFPKEYSKLTWRGHMLVRKT